MGPEPRPLGSPRLCLWSCDLEATQVFPDFSHFDEGTAKDLTLSLAHQVFEVMNPVANSGRNQMKQRFIRTVLSVVLVLVAAPWTHSQDDDDSHDRAGVGYEFADSNRDGKLIAEELENYLDERLKDAGLPHAKVFARMDSDRDGSVSEAEFENRHAVIEHFMGQHFFGAAGPRPPRDPGSQFVPFRGMDRDLDDRKIFGAIYHRYYESVETLDRDARKSLKVDLNGVAEHLDYEATVDLLKENAAGDRQATRENLFNATVVIGGGGAEFFTAGAVLISPGGLALTNYHVAEAMSSSTLIALGGNGETHQVVELLAGNRERDVAIIRLEAGDRPFDYVSIASKTPRVGDDIEMVHHSENRFFTYDRGYVMRHPVVGEHPWMEISSDYAPGGSGCGIYNQDRELVGLVSIIQYGDGPSIAEPIDDRGEAEPGDDEGWSGGSSFEGGNGMLLVKQAVSLSAIHSLLDPKVPMAQREIKEDTRRHAEQTSELDNDVP